MCICHILPPYLDDFPPLSVAEGSPIATYSASWGILWIRSRSLKRRCCSPMYREVVSCDTVDLITGPMKPWAPWFPKWDLPDACIWSSADSETKTADSETIDSETKTADSETEIRKLTDADSETSDWETKKQRIRELRRTGIRKLRFGN